jgi:hypothetical protein
VHDEEGDADIREMEQIEDNFCKTFLACNLPEIVAFRKQQATQNTKNSLYRLVREALEEERPTKEIVMDIGDGMAKTNVQYLFAKTTETERKKKQCEIKRGKIHTQEKNSKCWM